MTQDELKLVLEFVKSINLGSRSASVEQQRQVITAIEKALAQPEQEPVIDKSAAIRIATALGWTPQRTWVGLTDEEIAEVEDEYIVDYRIPAGSAWNFAKDIEAKLKEKNT
jgi:hypothetical protein